MDVKPVKMQTVSEQVFDQLRELIYSGALKSGERLMSERDLANQMKVSRGTIREAINRLSLMAMVERKQGKGTFVCSLESPEHNAIETVISDMRATLESLLEFRMGLECNAAAMAAERADARDIHYIEKSIDEMKREVPLGRLGTSADVSFHMAIAYSSKNSLQIRFMKDFYNSLFSGIRANRIRLMQVSTHIHEMLAQHIAIFNMIRNRDAKGAQEAMRKHIFFVLDFVRHCELSDKQNV
ncbi:MAG: FadR family transcriptional regulator [Deltaproteobacteria bacterium]|nr:FadR family transcriptional regulator [Deltaproteobacteria bacterium]